MIILISIIIVAIICALAYYAYKISEQFQYVKVENAALQSQYEQAKSYQEKYDKLLQDYLELQKNNAILSTNLEQEKKNLVEKMQLLENAEKKLSDTFKALSSDALSKNNNDFIALAKGLFEQMQQKSKADMELNSKNVSELLNPIKTALSGVDVKLGELEKSRVGAYEALKQQVSNLMNTENILKTETNNLVSALKAPNVRGRWGEMQLRRVVELSGMMDHCDFQEQVTSSEDKTIRPDMIIYYPGNKQVIIDAKTPLDAYLQSMEEPNEQRKKLLLKEYVEQIKKQITLLSNKQYWAQFESSPEFVVMFLPGEVFLSVAVEVDPSLYEFALQKHVIITTPTNLLALLRTIAFGWKQQKMADHAKEIKEMGQELYQRLASCSEYISDLGKSLNHAVGHYNKAVGNLEGRVMVTARKFIELKTSGKEILELNPIDDISAKGFKSGLLE